MRRQRNMYFDLVKGILIILVVLGHAIQYGNGYIYSNYGIFFDNQLFKFIYSFHMPLFMLISGYFFYYSTKRKTFSQILKGKVKSLVIPIVTYALIIKVYDYFIGDCDGTVLFYDFFRFTFLNYHLWFLWSVFLNILFVTIVHKFNDSYILYIAIGILLLLIPDHILHAVYSFVYPYFVLGYLANKYRITKRFVHNQIILFATSIIFLTLLAFYNKESYVYISGQCINRLNGIQFFVLDIYRFVTGITGCVFILVVIYWYYNSCRKNLIITSNIVMKFFTVLGNYSIGIYCFQDLLFNIYKRSIMPLINDSNRLNFMSTTITFFSVLILSITLTFLLRKNKYTNIIFLGDR